MSVIAGKSYGHKIEREEGHYYICWLNDRRRAGFPDIQGCVSRRWATRARARAFAERWGIELPGAMQGTT